MAVTTNLLALHRSLSLGFSAMEAPALPPPDSGPFTMQIFSFTPNLS